MLRISMAASLLAMTLSVDAFAAYPDQDDQKGNITYTYKGPDNTQQPENELLSAEEVKNLFVSSPFMPEEELRNFLSEWEKELALTRQQFKADLERGIHELTNQSLEEFRARLANFIPSEQASLPSMDLSTLFVKKTLSKVFITKTWEAFVKTASLFL